MIDIIERCEGNECPLKHYCLRHILPINKEATTYFNKPPYIKEEHICEYFASITEREFTSLKNNAIRDKEENI